MIDTSLMEKSKSKKIEENTFNNRGSNTATCIKSNEKQEIQMVNKQIKEKPFFLKNIKGNPQYYQYFHIR